jgi:hypothetical protein
MKFPFVKTTKPEPKTEDNTSAVNVSDTMQPTNTASSYVCLVCEEREALLGPIKAEIESLRAKEQRAIEIYHEEEQNGRIREVTLKALREIRAKLKLKEDELIKTDWANPIDFTALSLARQLDNAATRAQLRTLYNKFGCNVNELIVLSSQISNVSKSIGTLPSCGAMHPMLQYMAENINHDIFSLGQDNNTELRDKLNQWLNELRIEKEERQRINEELVI